MNETVTRLALKRLFDVCERMGAEHEADRPSEEEYQEALKRAKEAVK